MLWTREEFIHVSAYVVDCVHSMCSLSLQCFDAVGWAAGRASGL